MAKLSQMIVLFMVAMPSIVGAYNVILGAYYGIAGNNLPQPWQVVHLCRKYNIRRLRLYEANLDILQAFRGMGIDLTFGVPNNLIANMATNNAAVVEWFNTYIEPFTDDFNINYIVVGDRALLDLGDSILPVMKSLQDLLNAHYLGQVKLTTLVGLSSLAAKEPPSSGAFDPTIAENMRGILKFLHGEGTPLMVSIYPYKTCVYNRNISLDYATFNATNTLIRDGELSYNNLFDEMADAFYAAIEREAVGDVPIVVGETGWPTCGYGNSTTSSLAETYNRNFKSHISSGKGTPKKPNIYIEGFIQSLFNENEEPEGDSQCFGMFNVDSSPIYSVVF